MKAFTRFGGFSLFTASLLAIATGVGAPNVHAADSGWYIGGAIGQSKRDASSSDVARDVADIAEEVSGDTVLGVVASVDNTDTGWKLYAGYQINRNFALEAGYADLGKITGEGTATLTDSGGDYQVDWSGNMKVKSWSFSVVGSVPVSERFSVFGKLGIQHWQQKISGISGLTSDSEKESGTDPLWGLGVKFDMSKQLTLRAEWERFQDVGESKQDIDLLSLGLMYSF